MSETVKVGRNRPPQNGWASKEEVAELRAEVAELRETNQAMLEEIKGLRAELGGAKRRHFLGAVATSAAAFFGKFFHRGEDLGDIPEEKLGKRENRKGAHAKGKEKEKEKEKEKGGTPIVPARRDEKSKISRERENKRNKNKTPGGWKKALVGTLVATLAIGSAVYAFNPHKGAQDLPKDPSVTEVGAGDLRMPETEQALAEQAVEAAEAAHQQQLAETMGMSVEDMHAVADRHGVNHNDIGTVKAHDQMRDNMESSYNLSEKIDLENMSEAERSERSKQEILFANMNNKYVTAEISSARLGAHDASDSELTRQLFERYEGSDAVWQKDAEENAKFLKEATFSTYLADTTMANTYGTERQWVGPIEEQRTTKNSGGETVYMVEVANGDIKIQFKDGCVQAVWVEEVAQPRQQVKERTVVQREVVQKEEHHREAQGELRKEEYGYEEGERRTPPPPSDAKDEHADDTQEDPENKVTETPRSTDQAEASEDKQADKNGDGLPDSSGKSKSNNGEDDIKGKQGDTGEDRPANKNNTEADNGGSGSGEHVTGGGATDTGSGNQGGSDKGGTGSNKVDSGGSGKETSQNSQEGSSSWTRKWGSEERSSWRIGSDGKREESRESSSYDTGRVERNGNSNDAANGDVELQSSSVPTSVPISQED